jgi:hypothetical protein
MFCQENVSDLKKLIFLYELKNSLETNFGDNIEINGDLINIRWESKNMETTDILPTIEKPHPLNLLAKIFIAIFDNCLKHGDWLIPVKININRLDKKDFFLVSIENKIGAKWEKELEETLLEKLCSSFKLSTAFYNQFELKRVVNEMFVRGKLRLKSLVILSNKGEERDDIKTPDVIRYCLKNLNGMDYNKNDYEIEEPNENNYHQEKIRIKFQKGDRQ